MLTDRLSSPRGFAVCYDIIDKLRELALSGDKEAELQVKAIEETRAANNFARALQFERAILDLARGFLSRPG